MNMKTTPEVREDWLTEHSQCVEAGLRPMPLRLKLADAYQDINTLLAKVEELEGLLRQCRDFFEVENLIFSGTPIGDQFRRLENLANTALAKGVE